LILLDVSCLVEVLESVLDFISLTMQRNKSNVIVSQLRKISWYWLYEGFAWWLEMNIQSKDPVEVKCMNMGYAWLSSTGNMPKSDIRGCDELNRRQFQLYDFCLTTILDPYFNLQRQNALRYSESDSDVKLPAVLDLCCGRGGGIWFISQNYSLGQSMGVDISKFMIDYARKNP
jgi:hypothetical protein